MIKRENFLLVLCVFFLVATVLLKLRVSELESEVEALRSRGPTDIVCDGQWFQMACPPWTR